MKQYFISAANENWDDCSLIVQVETLAQVIPLWMQHFNTEDTDGIAGVYELPPIGPQIKALDWEPMKRLSVSIN